MNRCKVDGCTGEYEGLGYCTKHYQRFKKYGDPLGGKYHHSENPQGTKEYVLENIKYQPAPTGEFYEDLVGPCWIWQRYVNKGGYGKFNVHDGNKSYFAHIVSFELSDGEISKEKPFVLHKCDVRACCNPEHLYAGNQKDNGRDGSIRDRYSNRNPNRGEEHCCSILTKQQVDEIRSLRENKNMKYVEIAKIFGIQEGHVGKIIRGEIWAA